MKKQKHYFYLITLFLIMPSAILAQAPASKLNNPLGSNTMDLAGAASILISGAIGSAGILALIAFVWGSLEWILSQGDEKRITKGKDMMKWAVIGLFVLFASYAIINFILDFFVAPKV
ncbi:MAG: hypothetical protein WCL61_01635 [bacterium]